MKFIKFILLGMGFGIIMTKAEIISWYRIYEMFRFESFHMYGIIGSAIVLGIVIVGVIKKFNLKSIENVPIIIPNKQQSISRYILGGTIFGLGWAMTGACPGPMFTLVGNGFAAMLIVILSATLGTFIYGLIKNKLPH